MMRVNAFKCRGKALTLHPLIAAFWWTVIIEVNFSINGDEFWQILSNVARDPATFMREGGTLAVGQSMTRDQADELFEAMDMDQAGLLSLRQVRSVVETETTGFCVIVIWREVLCLPPRSCRRHHHCAYPLVVHNSPRAQERPNLPSTH